MTIESELYNSLSNFIDGRIYPSVAPIGTETPYLVFIVPSKVNGDVLCGQAEKRISIQIDIYDKSLFKANELLGDALELLSHLEPESVIELSGYEPDTELHRATVEFSITR